MTFWKRKSYGDSKKIKGCQGLGAGRDEWAEHRGFLGHETILCDTLMMDT